MNECDLEYSQKSKFLIKNKYYEFSMALVGSIKFIFFISKIVVDERKAQGY